MTKTGKNTTDHDRHVAGGPGKAAKDAHRPGGRAGNTPGHDNQRSEPHERGAGAGGAENASERQRDRTG
ncbi:hypothetical protein [Azospirillum sp. ST 5-10]|uniref:hypothetical protein n=1 Tax=unclassified Azospirillum TaxID=2630922 RepID=UPI003F49C1EB